MRPTHPVWLRWKANKQTSFRVYKGVSCLQSYRCVLDWNLMRWLARETQPSHYCGDGKYQRYVGHFAIDHCQGGSMFGIIQYRYPSSFDALPRVGLFISDNYSARSRLRKLWISSTGWEMEIGIVWLFLVPRLRTIDAGFCHPFPARYAHDYLIKWLSGWPKDLSNHCYP